MKSNCAWLVIVTGLVLVVFTSLAAQAAPLCEDLCNCIKKCTVRCTPTPPLPVLTCAEWGTNAPVPLPAPGSTRPRR